MKIIDSGYAESEEIFTRIKQEWAKKDANAIVKRVRTDTKGLIMYIVEKEA